MDRIILEELQNMKYLFGYKSGKVISEQATAPLTPPAAAPATVDGLIKQIQTILKTKYGANLGTSGPNKDGVDGKWGNLTQTALDQAIAKVKAGTQPPATGTQPPATGTQPIATVTTPAAVNTTAAVTVPTEIKAPTVQNLVPAKTPEQYYQELVSMNLIDPVGGNRIVYKGDPPAEDVKKTINDYLASQGYTQKLERNKNNGKIKLVYTK